MHALKAGGGGNTAPGLHEVLGNDGLEAVVGHERGARQLLAGHGRGLRALQPLRDGRPLVCHAVPQQQHRVRHHLLHNRQSLRPAEM